MTENNYINQEVTNAKIDATTTDAPGQPRSKLTTIISDAHRKTVEPIRRTFEKRYNQELTHDNQSKATQESFLRFWEHAAYSIVAPFEYFVSFTENATSGIFNEYFSSKTE